MRLVDAQPFFTIARGKYDELVVSGGAAVIDIHAAPLPQAFDITAALIPMRSLLKPVQALITARHLPKKDWQLIALASHSGEKAHENIIRLWSEQSGVACELLHCPACFPLDPAEAERARISGQDLPTKTCHPCIGKHLAYFLASQNLGAPSAYWEANHPLHIELNEFVKMATSRSVDWTTDSCGLPTCAVTLNDMAKIWHNFKTNSEGATQKLLRDWLVNPEIVGGTRRLDSWITKVSNGTIIAKEGADGLLAVSELSGPERTVVVKLSTGYDARNLAAALYQVINRCLNSTDKSPLACLAAPLLKRAEAATPSDQHFDFGS